MMSTFNFGKEEYTQNLPIYYHHLWWGLLIAYWVSISLSCLINRILFYLGRQYGQIKTTFSSLYWSLGGVSVKALKGDWLVSMHSPPPSFLVPSSDLKSRPLWDHVYKHQVEYGAYSEGLATSHRRQGAAHPPMLRTLHISLSVSSSFHRHPHDLTTVGVRGEWAFTCSSCLLVTALEWWTFHFIDGTVPFVISECSVKTA